MTETVSQPTSQSTAPRFTAYHHVAITVQDIEASEAWYGKVLGLVRAFVEPHWGGTSGYAVVMNLPGTAFLFGLEHHDDADKARFTPNRTGLDHLALEVGSRAEIDAWAAHLDALSVDRDPVVELTGPTRALLVFRDLDGMPLELIWHGH
jgi:catechol 2,3-dioxygenase-like lactoylglutathione lyase family enzyme